MVHSVINILNISSIKEIYNKPINKIEFMLDHLSKMEDLSRIAFGQSKISLESGKQELLENIINQFI